MLFVAAVAPPWCSILASAEWSLAGSTRIIVAPLSSTAHFEAVIVLLFSAFAIA